MGLEREACTKLFVPGLTLSLKVDQEKGLKEIKIYRHATVDSDLSIHLYWESDEVEKHGSTLGLHLVSSLKEFGRINHSIWIKDGGGEK